MKHHGAFSNQTGEENHETSTTKRQIFIIACVVARAGKEDSAILAAKLRAVKVQ
jgi:hypothetical protein